MRSPYEDIINLPHHVSSKRPRMDMKDRAAQFAPFSALTGYGSAIKEAGRITDEKIETDEEYKAVLDMKLSCLCALINEQPQVTVKYFIPDSRKAGGRYVKVTGNLKKIDGYEHLLILTNCIRIPTDDILDIESAVFGGGFE